MRRIETDDEAVQITTIHSAKGLEYPIVLVPFAYPVRANANRPYVYNIGPDRYVDVASWVAWSDEPDGARGRHQGRSPRPHARGDRRRQPAVAVRRARPAPSTGSSCGGRRRPVRGRRRWGGCCSTGSARGRCENSEIGSPFEKQGENLVMTRRQLAALAEASNGTIAILDVAVDQPVRQPLPISTAPASSADACREWTRAARRSVVEVVVVHGDHEVARRLGRSGRPRFALRRRPPRHRRTRRAGGRRRRLDPTDRAAAAVATHGEMPLADVVGGTTFGTMVHEILEHIDSRRPTISPTSCATEPRRQPDAPACRSMSTLLTTGLLAAIDTPLGPLFGGGRCDRSLRRPAGRAVVRPGDRRRLCGLGCRGRRSVTCCRRLSTSTTRCARTPTCCAPTSARWRCSRLAQRLDRCRVPRRRRCRWRAVRGRRLQDATGSTSPVHRTRSPTTGRIVSSAAMVAQPLPAAGAALQRRRSIATSRWRLGDAYDPSSAPRRRRLPVRARHGRCRHADGRRRAARRVLVATPAAHHRRARRAVPPTDGRAP